MSTRLLGDLPGVDSDTTIHDYIPGQPIPMLVRDPRTGKVMVNELKKYVKPFTLVTDPAVITLAADETSNPIPMWIDAKGNFEIMQAFFTSTLAAGFTVTLFETADRPLLMNREVPVEAIASGLGSILNYETLTTVGSAGRPFIWPESLFLDLGDRGRAIFAVFRNLSSTQSNTIRFCLHGQRWYHTQAPPKFAERMQGIYRERFRSFPFFYTTDSPLAAFTPNTTFERTIRFTDEAWVEWRKSMMATNAAAISGIRVRIRETSTQKRFMENPIDARLVFGNGELPFLNWEPSLFEPNYQLTIEFAMDAVVTGSISGIVLGCRKIHWDQKDDRLLRPDVPGGMP